MDRHMSESLDRYVTGNYGEDQFKGDEEFEIFMENTCSNCICVKWCPTVDKFYAGDDYEPCLIVKAIMDMREAQEMEWSRQMEEEEARIEFELQHDYPVDYPEPEMTDEEFQAMLDKDTSSD